MNTNTINYKGLLNKRTLTSFLQSLAYNLIISSECKYRDFMVVEPDGSIKIILDKVPLEVWKKFSDSLKVLGYDIRGGQDALELARKRSKDGGITVVYNPAKGDGDHIKAFYAAIEKKDLFKSKFDKNIIQKAIKQFGLTENPEEGGFILPDGKMLNFGAGYGGRAKDHREIGILFDDKGHSAIRKFCELGNIRLHIGHSTVNFDIDKRPTRDQLDKIEDIVYQYRKKTIVIDVPGSHQDFEDPETAIEFIKSKTGF